jgi:hypothetical protein
MSNLIKACSSPKYSFAISFAKNVLPTPLGQRNKNDPIGFVFWTTESLLLVRVFTIDSTASFCQTICVFKIKSSLFNLSISDSFTIFDGIPNFSDKTIQISSFLIEGLRCVGMFFCVLIINICFFISSSCSLNAAAQK